MRVLRTIVLAVAYFALGAEVMRFYDTSRLAPQIVQAPKPGANIEVAINFAKEPLWAYDFDRTPLPGEKARPQNPPNRNLRPNEDPEEQTRLRHVAGSKAANSLVDVRDGQNVIDWFPDEHPPMPNVVAHGPAALGKNTRGCGSCHLPSGKGRPENAGVAGLPTAYFIRQIH